MTMSFYADRTLGRLAKWLRILGFDTVSEIDASKSGADCSGNDRIRLSRKKIFCEQDPTGDWIAIESDHVMDQVRQVIKTMEITFDMINPFSRCLKCNTQLETADKQTVRHLVPDYVWETTVSFNRCPTCRKIYWPGSHHSRIMKTVQALFHNEPLPMRMPFDDHKERL